MARISVIGVNNEPGIAFQIFDTLAKSYINVNILLESVGREGTKDISFTVASEDLENALQVLDANKERLTIQKVTYNEDVAKLSVVGAGMMSNPGVAARMLEALYNSRVNINMISTSEIRITVLVAKNNIEKAMNAVKWIWNGGLKAAVLNFRICTQKTGNNLLVLMGEGTVLNNHIDFLF